MCNCRTIFRIFLQKRKFGERRSLLQEMYGMSMSDTWQTFTNKRQEDAISELYMHILEKESN